MNNGWTGCGWSEDVGLGDRQRVWHCQSGKWNNVAACGDCWSPDVDAWYKNNQTVCNVDTETHWRCGSGSWENLGSCDQTSKSLQIHASDVGKNVAANEAVKAAGSMSVIIALLFIMAVIIFALLMWCMYRREQEDAGDVAAAGAGRKKTKVAWEDVVIDYSRGK